MPKKTTTVIKEEVMQEQDSPAVLAYRVGQLEKTTAQGLKEVRDELVGLRNHFVTKNELEAAQRLAQEQHRDMEERIEASEKAIAAINKRTTSYTIVEKIVFTCAGVVLLTVLGAVIALVVTKV